MEAAVNDILDLLKENSGIKLTTERSMVIEPDEGNNIVRNREKIIYCRNCLPLSKEHSENEENESQTDTTGGPKKPQKRESEEDWLRNECGELFSIFSHRCLDAITRATKTSLDQLKRRVFVQRFDHCNM